jgi:hypothetical protein
MEEQTPLYQYTFQITEYPNQPVQVTFTSHPDNPKDADGPATLIAGAVYDALKQMSGIS